MYESDIKQEIDEKDDWDILYENIEAVDIKIDHIKILEEISATRIIHTNTMINLEKKIDMPIIQDYKICPNCDERCKIGAVSLICEKCGLEREWQSENGCYDASIAQNYNITQNAHISFNLVGAGSYCYQRSFLKTCSNYGSFRNNNNKKEITNIIYQYEGSKPPTNVINTAAELFDKIVSSGRVYRKNGKRGVMAACLYYSCIINNLSRTPRDIALIMNTEERFLSQGDKILQELKELGVLDIPTRHEPIENYLSQFFTSLDIPERYKAFVYDLIMRAEKKHIHIKNESRATTKCAGAIYMLTRRVKELKHIKKQMISKECNNMSVATFMRYYNLLYANYPLLKKSFKRHKITMPKEWKN